MIGYYLIFFLFLQNVDNGLDGNDQTLTPGQKIRTSKKKVQQLEAQVAQLKNSRYLALLSLCIFFSKYCDLYTFVLDWREGGVQKSYLKFVIVVSSCSTQKCIKKVIGGWTMRQIDIDSQTD